MRGKPTLGEYLDRNGNRKSENWYIFYYNGKRSCRKSTGCKIGERDHEANIALATFTLEREKPTAREPGTLMVAQALKDYYQEHAQFTASAVNARAHEARLNRFFFGQFVSQITKASIAKYVRECEGRSNGTTRRELAHLAAALEHEVTEGRLLFAPKFKLPEPPPPRDRVLSEKEIALVLEASKARMGKMRTKWENTAALRLHYFFVVMLETCQRPGAVEGLTRFQLDFKEGEINFAKTGRKKTHKQTRTVPMTGECRHALKELLKVSETEFVFGWKEKPGKYRRSVERLFANLGIEGASRYTLRHTAGNRLDIDGVDDRTISEIMGHTNVLTTRKHYLKKNQERMKAALERKPKTAQKLRNDKRGKK